MKKTNINELNLSINITLIDKRNKLIMIAMGARGNGLSSCKTSVNILRKTNEFKSA